MIRFALAAALLIPVSALGAPPGARDPDWPCQQIKVLEISLASVWSGPAVDTSQSGWKDDPAIADLVKRVAPRREPIDQAQQLIHDFAQRMGDRKQDGLSLLLIGLFNVLGEERNSVLSGLDRFGSRQKELAEQVRRDNEELRTLQSGSGQSGSGQSGSGQSESGQSGSGADPAAVQQLTQKVTWEVQVFQDRRQALSYACEVPGKIEQRLFALVHQIQHELQ